MLMLRSEVKTTTDYGQFQQLEGNRQISEEHLRQLIQSYESHPELIVLRPIMVNEKMEIVDGQHRFMALKAMEAEIPFIEVPGLTIETAQLLNATQRPWGLIDFVRSYAVAGKKPYQVMLNKYREYGVSLTPLASVLSGKSKHKIQRTVRQGQLELREDLDTADTILNHMQDLGAKFHYWREYNFAMAILVATSKEGYDYERMIEKVKARPLTRSTSQAEYLRQLETVYNDHVQQGNWTRFLG